jgi:galactose-1-phosphate uridylyltransferase
MNLQVKKEGKESSKTIKKKGMETKKKTKKKERNVITKLKSENEALNKKINYLVCTWFQTIALRLTTVVFFFVFFPYSYFPIIIITSCLPK